MRALVLPLMAAALLAAAESAAQPATPPAPVEMATHAWSASAGYDVFSLRDISRNIRPPDASPIAWRGSGPVVAGRYQIAGRRSAHLLDAGMARARNFAYVSPLRSVDAAAADLASRFEARYEYRRYPWRDLLADGLDLGLGIQGIGSRAAFDRHITTALSTKTRITGGGVAGVVAARLQRWERLHLEASWANGGVISRRTAEHSATADSGDTYGGGHWLSDTLVRADVGLTRTMRLELTWRRYVEGYSSSHFAYAGRRQSFHVGVLYAR